MANTGPVRFERVAAAFNEASRVIRLYESGGSEHFSPDNSSADLVNSFIETEYRNQFGGIGGDQNNKGHRDRLEDSSDCSYSENKERLENLLNIMDDVREKICKEIGFIGERSSQSSKHRLMSRLRDRGFDAGLCKSRWEKFGRHPAGDYEYVDVNVSGNRYIVEVFLAGEFEIARPTSRYAELLDAFPRVYVGTPEDVEQIVRLMCNAMRESMKAVGMHVPPWRRNGYLQAKWFGHYKRTTLNEVSTRTSGSKSDDEGTPAKRATGFEALPVRVYYCRDDIASNGGLGVSHLTAAFRSNGIDR
ncbi:hypothetical protein POTOM_060616 [Populus tomentosa]|uniref:DUF506 family protein n=1 Tax=Populus tomentosa TaxID=118781 RepID=A0A8X7XTL9_POPTO|nr:hypothetical protein POTOM_060616 [Populus tomentosa]